MDQDIGALFEHDLERVGITQKELGDRLGVTQQAVSNWIRKKTIPARQQLRVFQIIGMDSPTAKAVLDGQQISATRIFDKLRSSVSPYKQGEPETPQHEVREEAPRQAGYRSVSPPGTQKQTHRRREGELDDLLEEVLGFTRESGSDAINIGYRDPRFDYVSQNCVALFHFTATEQSLPSPGRRVPVLRGRLNPRHMRANMFDLLLATLESKRQGVLIIVTEFDEERSGGALEAFFNKQVEQLRYEGRQVGIRVESHNSIERAVAYLVEVEGQADDMYAQTSEDDEI